MKLTKEFLTKLIKEELEKEGYGRGREASNLRSNEIEIDDKKDELVQTINYYKGNQDSAVQAAVKAARDLVHSRGSRSPLNYLLDLGDAANMIRKAAREASSK